MTINGKAKTILLWIGRIAMAAVFFMAGSQKLMGSKMMVDEFTTVGLGQWFRYFTAAMEIGGALLLLWPKTSFYGALVLLCVLVGAFFAHILVLGGDVVHVFAFAAVVLALVWFQRPGFAVGAWAASNADRQASNMVQ